MATTKRSDVTLLHKGVGPSLFLNRTPTLPVVEQPDSGRSSAKSTCRTKCLFQADPPPAKRVIVKCADRQDANSMFAKRLRDRRQLLPPVASVRETITNYTKKGTPSRKATVADQYAKERLFTNTPHKVGRFPPLSYMPRWNPRHKDTAYLDQMTFDDPWSLSKEQRIQLQKLTGLRLKTMSQHYQYKAGLNLPLGKDVLEPTDKCTCNINYCDHCQKSHVFRCPLHMQLLDPVQADCKLQLTKACPFQKNPEDMALEDITDAATYVSEVVRRLRAGEIQEPPQHFPSKLLLDPANKKLNFGYLQKIEEPISVLELTNKKVETENAEAQTDPLSVDVDMRGSSKENLCQTTSPGRDVPIILKKVEGHLSLKTFTLKAEAGTEVTPFLIEHFDILAQPVVKKVARQVIGQALQEIYDQMGLRDAQKRKSAQFEILQALQRKMLFRVEQAKYRASMALLERSAILQEIEEEELGECGIAATCFAYNYLRNLPVSTVERLRQDRYMATRAAHTDAVRGHLNEGVMEYLKFRKQAARIVDAMIAHAARDLKMDQYKSSPVNQKYLDPNYEDTAQLEDVVELNTKNRLVMIAIKSVLRKKGWEVNDSGELVYIGKPSPTRTAQELDTVDVMLRSIKVTTDRDGNPKHLKDAGGLPLPITVKFLKQTAGDGESGRRSSKMYDLEFEMDSPHSIATSLTWKKQDEEPGEALEYSPTEVDETDGEAHVVYKRPSEVSDVLPEEED